MMLIHKLHVSSHALSLSLHVKESFNETSEDPTSWTTDTFKGEQELDRTEAKLNTSEEKEEVVETSSLRMNLTAANSTSNYTTAQEVKSTINMLSFHLLFYMLTILNKTMLSIIFLFISLMFS